MPTRLEPAAPRIPATAPLAVTYHIDEGDQLRVGSVQMQGNDHIEAIKLAPLLNTTTGQLLSPQNLSGDRDALLTEYLSRGFEQVAVEVAQQPEGTDPSKVDVVFHVNEGPQIFVRNVLVTGLHYTRPDTVNRVITLHAGNPLNQTALLDTQSNLYELALFNEVNAAVENPTGGETHKTILLQAVEARRWALTYGFGFETQTGTPQNNCAGASAGGVPCNPNGKTGISPRVLADLTRNNVFGRDQSASLQGTYGLLEQKIDLLFQIPHFEGDRNFGVTFSGGYANSQDVTTYVASRLEAGFRFTQNFQTPGSFLSKANTFIYEYDFRRVKVSASSLQVFPGEIVQLATAVRVAGPGVTWIRDTRDSPLDAHRGTYTSFQEFLSVRTLGAEAQFNRLDLSNSSYYGFDKGRFVLARNTRYGQIRAFGTGQSELIPLPERLYSGGPTSLRGFSFNAAGPRDPETGYPIGGAGALVNTTELRLPPPTLPWVGNTVSFVLFHDMGNVFTNAGDAWASILRFNQPDRDTCKTLSYPTTDPGHGQAGCARSDRPNHIDRPPGHLQLQLLLAYARHRTALPYTRWPHPLRFQLQPQYAHLPSESQLFTSDSRFPAARWRSNPLQLFLQPGAELLMHMRRPIRMNVSLQNAGSWLAAAGFLVCLMTSFAQPAQPKVPVIIDSVEAIVNRHVILASDIDEELRLSVLDPVRGGMGVLTRQVALEQLISRALIEQQIRREDEQTAEPSPDEVSARLADIRKELPACVRGNCVTDTGWRDFLSMHDLTTERVESYLRFRLEILRFIEERFRPAIHITPQEIETYYRNTLLPQYGPGEAVPTLERVSSRIEEILLQQQVNALFDDWLTNLRKQGDVEILDPALASVAKRYAGQRSEPHLQTVERPATVNGEGKASQ